MKTAKLGKVSKTILKHEDFFIKKINNFYEELSIFASNEDLQTGEFGILLNTFCMNLLFIYFHTIDLPLEKSLEYLKIFSRDLKEALIEHFE